jgi:MarR family transcriptional regulator for hemolysin
MSFMPLANLPAKKRMAFLIQDVARLLRNKLDHLASEAGLTTAQWRVIATVARCRGANLDPPNQASLAEMLEVEPITLSRQIDRLAAAGLIERRPDPSDRRAHRLYLTDKAQPLVEGFRNLGNTMMRTALEGVSDDEVDTVIAVLERLRANITGKTATQDTDAPTEKTRVKEGVPT